EVFLVQIDGDINPGNSGGPVVDGRGRLVGVAVARVRGTRIGLAIPPAELGRMLEGRVAGTSFRARPLAKGVAEVQLEARVIDPPGKLRDVAVYLVRQDALKEKPRPGKGGAWDALPGARRVPLAVTGPQASGTVRLTASGDAPVTFLVQTAYSRAGGPPVYGEPRPHLVPFGAVTAARPGGPQDPPAIQPPELSPRTEAVPLGAPAGDVPAGGGGRYVVLHLPRDRKLAVFDVSAAKVVKHLPVAADKVKLAAGRDKLLVALADEGLVQRWSLTTLEREATARLPVRGAVTAL